MTYMQRHYANVVAFVVGVIVGASLLWHVVPEKIAYAPQGPLDQSSDIVSVASTTFARSAPVLLEIPALNMSAEFEAPLRLNPDKTIEVPDSFDKVGWYEYGATPGEVGSAAILGHVDSYKGPAVFYNLGKLEVGDEVHVKRADGTTATFIVETLERYDQDVFPSEKVYGTIEYPGIRLITCSGVYDKKTQRYSHNLVVYGRLKN
jgi:sortase (surface protein transpeptidase)